jgi:hypothetical protein
VGAVVKRVGVGMATVLVWVLVAGVPAACAEALSPWWGVTSGSQPTDLISGQAGRIVVTAENLGDASTSGEVTIVDTLPAGLEVISIEGVAGESIGEGKEGARGPVGCDLQTLTCTFLGSLHPYDEIEVDIAVSVQGAVSGEQNTASVSGGGASSPASASRSLEVDGSEKFGVEDFQMRAENVGGTIDTQAGSHPFQLTSVVTLNTTTPDKSGPRTVDLPKDIVSELPAGLLGDATGFAQCTDTQFAAGIEAQTGAIFNQCPAASAIGAATLTFDEPYLRGFDTVTTPIFNLTPLPDEPARLGIDVLGQLSVALHTSIRSGGDYGVTLTLNDLTELATVLSLKLTLWGVPGDPRHDGQRGWECLDGYGTCAPSTETTPSSFLSLPTSCGRPLVSTVVGESWVPPQPRPLEWLASALMPALTGCEQLPFEPRVAVSPEVPRASEPSGLSVDLRFPQAPPVAPEGGPGAGSEAAVTASDVKDIALALPEGVALNPAGTNGLAACSESQIGYQPAASEPLAGGLDFSATLPEPLEPGINFCPNASKIGTVKVKTPILENALEGAVYLAAPQNFASAPEANPFRSMLAVYILARDPVSGVLIKLPGRLTLDPTTAQLTASFENTPQLPLEELELDFNGGSGAPLSTPALCRRPGEAGYRTVASFTPWSGSAPVTLSAEFSITSGPGGGPCPNPPGDQSASALPFAPTLVAGSLANAAGSFSPLSIGIGRGDGQQDIRSLQLKLPPGVSAILAGVPFCPEAQANAGTCGAESQIGSTTMRLGLGPQPEPIEGGRVYLTGPYNGTGPCIPGSLGGTQSGCAPFGLSIVVPAVAGPFDLQEGAPIVVRGKLEVDPATAQITIATNGRGPYAIPSIVDGFLLQVKHINITIDRPGFIFNPTSCNKMATTGEISSAQGTATAVSSSFQVSNCRTQKFAPKLTAVTRANGEFEGHGASLHLTITTGASPSSSPSPSTSTVATTTTSSAGTQINLRSLKLDLPQRLPARLGTIQKACPEKTFDQNPAKCPKGSVVGSASVHTPILAATMTGPAYLVAKGASGTSTSSSSATSSSSSKTTGQSKTEKEEAAFPNLVLVLQGQGVRINLTGALFVSEHNITSVTFRSIPDVPIRRLDLVLPEGKTSILAASAGLCTKKPLRMTTAITGQNGAKVKPGVTVEVSGCKKPKRHKQMRPAKKRHKQ